jgi:hypothetical protein
LAKRGTAAPSENGDALDRILANFDWQGAQQCRTLGYDLEQLSDKVEIVDN